MTDLSTPQPLLPKALRWLCAPWLGPLVLLGAAATMLAWTWGTWCDPIKDFGREIYIAWRLSAGQVLYRDIDYFNGPVSPYLNSLIFRTLGASLFNLQLANLLEWAALLAMSYRLYTVVADRLSAFVACLLFIALFSFIQLAEIANYNYVSPYAHEITHSLTCATGILVALNRYLRTGNHRALATCGLLLGLIFMMKIEVTLAAGAALTVGFLGGQWTRPSRTRWSSGIAIVVGSTLIPIAVAFVLLWTAMPAGQAWRGVMGSWKYLGDARITNNPFYRHITGTDDVRHNTLLALRFLGEEMALLAAAAIAALCTRGRVGIEGKAVAAGATAAGAIGVVIIAWDQFGWQGAMRPLNAVAIACSVWWLIALLRRPREQVTPKLIMRLAFSVFGLTLLAKMFFAVVIFHYGFALAAPAFALLVVALVSWVPSLIERAGGGGCVFRAAAVALLVAFTIKYVQVYNQRFRPAEAHEVGSGADQFSTYNPSTKVHIGDAVQKMVSTLEKLPPDQTVACLPEGAMINYLSRRVNPTGETTLLPGEVFMFGEARVLERFTAHPPDWIVTVQSDTKSFGYEGFGRDYAKPLFDWIADNYREATPSTTMEKSFPMHLLKHDPTYASTRPAFGRS